MLLSFVCIGVQSSFHDQDRTVCQLHDSIGTATDQALIHGGMASSPNDRELGAPVLCEVDDIMDRMARHNMGFKFDLISLRQCFRPPDY